MVFETEEGGMTVDRFGAEQRDYGGCRDMCIEVDAADDEGGDGQVLERKHSLHSCMVCRERGYRVHQPPALSSSPPSCSRSARERAGVDSMHAVSQDGEMTFMSLELVKAVFPMC